MSDHRFGWHPDPEAVQASLARMPRPMYADHSASIKGTGKGKVALLWQAIEQLHGSFPISDQTIGDCVSHGMAGAAQCLMATDIVLRNERELWKGLVATEPIYAGSRVEVGKGRLGNDDGSVGAWAAEWVVNWGVIVRGKYGDIDLSTYSGATARAWGKKGVGCPDSLEPIAKEHPIKTSSLVTSYEDVRDLISNGYPVSVASDVGFDDDNRGNANGIRDADGFLTPRGTWYHQMFFVAVDDDYKRPGCLCVQSWGVKWGSGPKRHNQPDGTFWVDAATVDRMVRQKDSFGYSGFEGFPAQDLDYILL